MADSGNVSTGSAAMTDRTSIGPKDIGRMLEIVHGLLIHPEAVRIPLDAAGSGSVRIEGGRLVLIAPAVGALEPWFAALPERIRAVPGYAALKRVES
jgi:hypothetical protein